MKTNVGPDLGPICWQRLRADHTSWELVNKPPKSKTYARDGWFKYYDYQTASLLCNSVELVESTQSVLDSQFIRNRLFQKKLSCLGLLLNVPKVNFAVAQSILTTVFDNIYTLKDSICITCEY